MISQFFQSMVNMMPARIRALLHRFESNPVDTVEKLMEFGHTRSAFVAQTSLYGYLKTRMGTQFPKYFEDQGFSRSIRIASVKLFVSCLADLTVYNTAQVAHGAQLSREEAAALAVHCFEHGLRNATGEIDRDHVPADAVDLFTERAKITHWANAAAGTEAFSGSEGDLIRMAPVIDEFKKLDEEIVTNSIRFRWIEIRDAARRRIVPEGVCADWRAKSG